MSGCPPGRKAIEPTLPVVAWKALPPAESVFKRSDRVGTANLLLLLRQLAIDAREKQPRPFYSIRTVARCSNASLTTVARIYARLKKEGILGSVWGSTTIVEPYELNKDLHIRGVVALPTSLKAFCALCNYRVLFEHMQLALWRVGFATRQLFYEDGDIGKASFNETLLNKKVDVVLWLLPNSAAIAGSKCFLDHGVRIIRAANSVLIRNDRSDYLLSRLQALKKVLQSWKLKGVRLVTIVLGLGPTSPAELLQTALSEAGIPYAILKNSPSPVNLLRSLGQENKSAVIFPVSEPALQLEYEDPQCFTLLTKQHPVLLMEGMLDLPNNLRGIELEFIEFDWHPVANRIASDLFKWKRHSGDK